MLGVTLVVAVVLGTLAGVRLAARRYEARQRRLGRWDEYGPLVETEAPPKHDYRMSERTEVVGQWHGKVLRRREPHEKP